MSRQQYFPRAKYFAMQAIMCVLLCGTIGLAALLDQHLHKSQVVQLSDPIGDNWISFRAPVGWKMDPPVANDDGGLYHISEPDQTDTQRNIFVRHLRIGNQFLGPMQYIRQELGQEPQTFPQPSAVIDGHNATTVRWQVVEVEDNQPQQLEGLAYCVIVPGSQVITITFQRAGELSTTDRILMSQVLDSIKILPGN